MCADASNSRHAVPRHRLVRGRYLGEPVKEVYDGVGRETHGDSGEQRVLVHPVLVQHVGSGDGLRDGDQEIACLTARKTAQQGAGMRHQGLHHGKAAGTWKHNGAAHLFVEGG